MTVAFGHGISVSPLHVVRGTAAVANGGIAAAADHPGAAGRASSRTGVRVMQPSTSDIMRKLMRLVVTDGFGKQAEVPGYYPGGKTGTAEKVGKHGYKRGYKKHANVAAFMSVFPMNAPRYAVYMMLDEPHGNKSTYGYSTAGWVAAPAAGRVIARIAPMLGMLPDIQDAPAINQALSIPLQPGRPAGAAAAGRSPSQRRTTAAKPIPAGPTRPDGARHHAAAGTRPAPARSGAAARARDRRLCRARDCGGCPVAAR